MNNELLNALGVTQEELLKLAVEKLADMMADQEDMYDKTQEEISRRLDKLFAKRIDAALNDFLKEELDRLVSATVTPTDIWGEKIGEPTTIRDALIAKAKDYWATKVDSNGDPAKNNYGRSQPRSEWLMSKLLQTEFDAVVKQNIVNVLGALKESMREDIAKKTSAVLDELIRVKTK